MLLYGVLVQMEVAKGARNIPVTTLLIWTTHILSQTFCPNEIFLLDQNLRGLYTTSKKTGIKLKGEGISNTEAPRFYWVHMAWRNVLAPNGEKLGGNLNYHSTPIS